MVLHVTFWLLFLSFKYVDYSQNLPTTVAIKFLGVQNLFNMSAAYLHYFLLLPLLVDRRKYRAYTFATALMMALVILGRAWLESQLFDDLFGSDYYSNLTGLRIFNLFWTTASFVIFIALLNFTVDRFILEGEKKALENEKLITELNYLKAQINPHFLFNTLHNLNYLTHTKSDQATELVIKLSNIMRYMIYESDKPFVPLSREIDYVKDYLDLEKIRLNKPFELTFDVSHVDTTIEIPPLILIPFVENAFKHGVSDANDNSWVSVELFSDAMELVFQVRNGVASQLKNTDEKSGFGLENVKKRLALSLPQKHSLDIKEGQSVYEVTFKMKLQ